MEGHVIVGIMFYATVALVSFLSYRDKKSDYALDKSSPIPSFRFYYLIHKYVQVSTFLVCVASLLFKSGLLLRVHDDLAVTYLGFAVSGVALSLFVSAKLTLG